MTVRDSTSRDPTKRERGTTTGGGPATPRYPQVRVRLARGDGPAGILIGKVAVALRYRVGDQAADTFKAAAHDCAMREQLLRLIRATVRAR